MAGQFDGEVLEGRQNRSHLCTFAGALDDSQPRCAQSRQHVLLRRAIIDESSLAHVGCFRDVLDGGFEEPALREESKCCTENAVANFCAPPFATTRCWQMLCPLNRRVAWSHC